MISQNIQNPEINEEILPVVKDVASTETKENCMVAIENETTLNQECTSEMIKIVTKYQLNPTRLRYVFKKVREETKLVISKISKPLPTYFTPAEAYLLIETARKIGIMYSMLIQLLIQTGLRISEARNLDLRHIQRDNNTLRVVEGKGRKDRIVPIGSRLAEDIFLYCKPRQSGNIFVHRKTLKPLSVRRLQQMVSEVSEKAGLGKSSPHTLRRTYGCILINKGFKLEDIQLFLGHSSRITTEIYAKIAFTPEQKEKYLQLFP